MVAVERDRQSRSRSGRVFVAARHDSSGRNSRRRAWSESGGRRAGGATLGFQETIELMARPQCGQCLTVGISWRILMRRRDSWSTEEWIVELDKVIEAGGRWLEGLPPRSEGENPAVSAAKQLAVEACEFASSVSAAAQRSHWVSAYANSASVGGSVAPRRAVFRRARDYG